MEPQRGEKAMASRLEVELTRAAADSEQETQNEDESWMTPRWALFTGTAPGPSSGPDTMSTH